MRLAFAKRRGREVEGQTVNQELRFRRSSCSARARLGPLQEAQLVGHGCQTLIFNIYSSNSYEMLKFTVEYLDTIEQNSTFTFLKVYMRKCPPGFQLSDDECIYAAPFQNVNVTCDINDMGLSIAVGYYGYTCNRT